MLGLISFLGVNGLLVAGAALVVRYCIGVRDALGATLATMLLSFVVVVVGLEGFAAIGQLGHTVAAFLAIGSFVAGLAAWRWSRAGMNMASSSGGTSVDASADTSRTQFRSRVWLRLAAGLAAALALWAALDVLVAGLMRPVQPISDAPIYHLYFAVRWWQAGRLELVPTPFGESAAPYFPANGDLWLTWLLLPWRAGTPGSEALAKVGQWPFLLLGAAAVYAIAREFGGRPASAVIPAALWTTSTLPLEHAGWADVDLIMAAWYLVATLFLLRCARSRGAGDLACSALAAGAALGTKYVAILFVPWLVLGATVFAWRGPRRWRHLALVVTCVAIPSAFWFARNAWLTGNPLYPLHLELFGMPLLKGWYTRGVLTRANAPGAAISYHIPVGDWRALVQILLRAADPVLLPVWIASVVAALASAMARMRKVGRIEPAARGGLAGVHTPSRVELGWFAPWLLVALACLHIGLYWCVNPYQTQERFLFAAFGLLAAPLVLALERAPFAAMLIVAAIAWHLVVNQWGPNLTAVPGPLPAPFALLGKLGPIGIGRLALFAALVVSAVLLRWMTGTSRRRVVVGIAVAGVLAAGVIARAWPERIDDPRLRFFAVSREVPFILGWQKLESASDRGRRVAYAGTNLPYYLFGIGLRNDVRYVNIDVHTDFRMHDYHAMFSTRGERLAASSTPDWDRRVANEAAWLDNLRRERIELLFVSKTNAAGGMHAHNFFEGPPFPIELTWAEGNSHVFEPLHRDGETFVYAVRF